MAIITRKSDRLWIPSVFDSNVEKVPLYSRSSEGLGRSLFSRSSAGQKTPGQWSDTCWDIFVLSGTLCVNGTECGASSHIRCTPYTRIEYETSIGAEIFIFIRTNHEWWEKSPPTSIWNFKLGDSLDWQSSINHPGSEKATLYDGREGHGRSMLSRVMNGKGKQQSSKSWEMLILDGSWDVAGERIEVGDHCLCLPNEEIVWNSTNGMALVCFR